ncbi:MAG: 2-hydroxyacid dehydrogenase [Kineosporiaceae bacterium]
MPADAPPTVLLPWPDVAVPPGLSAAVYDGAGDPPDVRAVELYVVPYGGSVGTLELIADLPALRAVQVLTAGVDAVLPHVPAGVVLHSGRGLHDASTAEHAVGLILAAQRELPRWVRDQAAGRWDPHYTRSLAGSRVLVVGFGSIGEALAARLRPFEVDVVPLARRARPDQGVLGVDALDAELPRADVVVLLTPLTAATRGLLDRRRLALLPDGALLVNVARGPVLDTGALLAERGRVRAALDVTDPEPLPPGHPLWGAPGVLLTPHVAGGSATFHPRARRFLADQLQRWAAGEPLHNRVER